MQLYMIVYIPNQHSTEHFNITRGHDLPFHFERANWQITHDLDLAEVIPVLNSVDQDHLARQKAWLRSQAPHKVWDNCLIMVMFHTHTSGDEFQPLLDSVAETWQDFVKDPRQVVCIHLNQREHSHVYYDFCWHRHQQYYFRYHMHDLDNRMWTGQQTSRAFELSPVVKTQNPRRFLIPNNVRDEQGDHMDRRRWLRQFSSDRDCYWSDPATGHLLAPEEDTPAVWAQLINGGSGWHPIDHRLYNDSWISAYVETVTKGNNHICITEKTYEPLIRGHYIVPLGTKGFVNALRDLGFSLGNLVDYAYDSIDDDQARTERWKIELKRLRYLKDQEIQGQWQQDKGQLINNRRVLESRKTPELYWAVSQHISRNGLDIRSR
jgi:hypothetical protein